MTHTLHRHGTEESLQGDFVVLMMAAKGHNDSGSAWRLRDFLRLADESGATNLGDMAQGSLGSGKMVEELEEGVTDRSIVHAAFSSLGAAESFIKALGDWQAGLSVVLTGLVAPAEDMCRRLRLIGAPHTVAFSLGLAGRADLLPRPGILAITTMCGHGLIGPRLIEKAVADIRSGEATPESAARTLAGPCTCGVLNPERAASLLADLAG